MSIVKLPVIQQFYTQMAIYTTTHNTDDSLVQKIQNNLSNELRRNGIIDDGQFHYGHQV